MFMSERYLITIHDEPMPPIEYLKARALADPHVVLDPGIDLLLYHRLLKCLVVIDLKLGKFTHADAGQMNLYLNYAREHLTLPEENAERLVARVQFALQSFEDLRGHDFGAAAGGKTFEWKLGYVPPKDMSENLPGGKPRDAATSGGTIQGLGNSPK